MAEPPPRRLHATRNLLILWAVLVGLPVLFVAGCVALVAYSWRGY